MDGPIVVAVIDAIAPAILDSARAILGDAERRVVALSVAWPYTSTILVGEACIQPTDSREGLLEALEAVLRREVAAVAPGDPRWHARVEYGDPDEAIARVAREERATLLLMGIGKHGLSDRIVGSETALRVIRLAPCPVLAVAGTLRSRPRTVVVAADFSADSIHAAELALPLLADDAKLHFVHAWAPENGRNARAVARDAAYRAALPARFTQMLASLDLPTGISASCEVREDKPASAVLAFAAAHHADLIVAGRHGAGAMERLFVGSVTSALLRAADCSVLIAPEPHHAGG